jgi:NitT/TauT family transport system substrate-binding protein
MSLVATAVVMAILIGITGYVVFAGPVLVPGPTSVENLPTGSANSSVISTGGPPVSSTHFNGTSLSQSSTTLAYSTNATSPPEAATVMLDYIPGAQHALFYEAEKQGYYQTEGLSVGIKPGIGSASTVGSVADGQAQFGFVDASTAINSISSGAGVQIIGAVTDSQPFAVFYLSNSGINSTKDLEGKTYCGSVASADHVMFPAFAAKAGINVTTIKFMNVDPPFYSLLAAGECQFTTDFLYGLPNYQAALNQSTTNASVRYFLYSSYGIDPYGYVLIANDNVITTNPNLVERFVNATYAGLQYVLNNRQQALNDTVSIIPGATPGTEQPRFAIFINESTPLLNQTTYRASDPRTLGLIDPALLNQTAAYTVEYLKAKPVPASQIFTNDFLTCDPSKCG